MHASQVILGHQTNGAVMTGIKTLRVSSWTLQCAYFIVGFRTSKSSFALKESLYYIKFITTHDQFTDA
jgi:hypothetical protein